jgi:hypothetical protein
MAHIISFGFCSAGDILEHMKWLTKSDYMHFLAHPAWLWISKYDKSLLPEIGEIEQSIFDQGYEVQDQARKLWPEGVEVKTVLTEGVEETKRLMAADGPEAIFEASVLTQRRLYARADVLLRAEDDVWDLYEIKSSTKVKESHTQDLAFQKLAFEEAGHKVGRCFVAHLNAHYTRIGDIIPGELFEIVDVTDQVEPLAHWTKRQVEAALAIIAQPQQCPSDAPEMASNWKQWEPIYRLLHPSIPDESVLNLCRINPYQLRRLRDVGYERIKDIPVDFPDLKSPQVAQIEASRTGQPKVHALRIAHQLNGLVFPLYFLDYETASSAVPIWEGTRPYQQLPFQYSLHVIDKPGGEVRHLGYLAQTGNYPVQNLLDQLSSDIGPRGSVIVWYKPFEMGCNEAMALLHPEHAEFLHDVNHRVFDLMEIFSNQLYSHPSFFGSASIKKVLPVLVPELSYKDLGIGEGMTAQLRWMKAASGGYTPEGARQVYDDLIEYCGQDTLAMVRIYQHLCEVAASSRATS